MFQTGFQSNAYQANQGASNDNGWLGGGLKDKHKHKYTYAHPYIQYQNEEAQREKIRREKSELEKLESVIAENKRKAELAARNKLIAQKKAALRLATLEAEFLEEINRLMQVRASLLLRIRQSEEALIMILIAARRRLRA